MENKPKEIKTAKKEVKRTPEEEAKLKLQREKLELLNKQNASINIDKLFEDTITDRQFASKFKKVFATVRKSLVVLKAKKIRGEITSETAYNTAFEVFEKARDL